MAIKHVLIAGATGQIGASVGRHFLRREDWRVVGLSRRAGPDAGLPLVAADLLDADDCRERLGKLPAVTHVVYAARYDHHGGEQESVDTNLRMFSNLLAAVEGRGELRHVHLVHGTKYYGHMAGPRPVPYREDDPRPDRPLFYYPQQDLLLRRRPGHGWDWSISRPHTFCDLNADEPRSITLIIGIYASILKELGLPLRFPGTRAAFEARTQVTWLPMLARAVEWMMSDPACANQAFNVVNGDPMRWSELWPVLADYFGMGWTAGEPLRFKDFPEAHAAVWDRMVEKYGLRPGPLRDVAQWAYADYVFVPQWDVVSSMEKAARFGFKDDTDTPKMWRDSFDFYRTRHLIP